MINYIDVNFVFHHDFFSYLMVEHKTGMRDSFKIIIILLLSRKRAHGFNPKPSASGLYAHESDEKMDILTFCMKFPKTRLYLAFTAVISLSPASCHFFHNFSVNMAEIKAFGGPTPRKSKSSPMH